MSAAATTFTQSYFHGTSADLAPGDRIQTGHVSNFAERVLSWVYFSATLDAAIGGRNLRGARGLAASMWSNRPGRSRTTRT